MAHARTVAVVETDRLDEPPGTNVGIAGSGLVPSEEVELLLHEEPPVDLDLEWSGRCEASASFVENHRWTDIHDIGTTLALTAAEERKEGSNAEEQPAA